MKKKKKWIIIAVIVLVLIIGAFGGNDDEDKTTSASDNQTTTEETKEPVQEEAEEPVEEEKTPEQLASEMGQQWFTMINWDEVFKYKSDVHYIMDYQCIKTPDDLKKYGKYVAMAGADLQNGFGAEFKSTVYIFMDKDGIIKHVFYDEADGSSTEIPLDSIPAI